MNVPQKFIDLLDKLILDGGSLLNSSQKGYVQDRDALLRWSNDLLLLHCVGRDLIKPWRHKIGHDGKVILIDNVKRPLAALESVKYAIDNGLLTSFRGLVLAEEFASLHEQGSHLLDQGYYLAAAVIFRAVLEEKLRELCEIYECMPDKERPGINDLNQALYKNEGIPYDKPMMKNVESLAAIGNAAAHHTDDFNKEDVDRLSRGVLEFLARYSG